MENLNLNTIQEKECCKKIRNLKYSEIRFCPYCGRSTGRISDPILTSDDFQKVNKVKLKEGESFSIRFEHISGDSVSIKYNISNAENIKVKDKNKCEDVIVCDKNIGQTHLDLCLMDYTKEVRGYITFKYSNPERDSKQTWKRKDIWTKEIQFELKEKILIDSKECILGSEFLFFSNKIKQQNISIYNPFNKDKIYTLEEPYGYSITPYSQEEVKSSSLHIKRYNSKIISINKEKKTTKKESSKWLFEKNEVELFELPTQTTNIIKSPLKISFDLGTQKIAIRAYWNGFAPLYKKTGEIDEIEGYSFSPTMHPTMPPTMLLDVNEKEKYFFEEAEKLKKQKKELIEIKELKNCLRNFNDRYTKYNKNWTNEYLLSLIFSKISEKIKQWMSELFKTKNKPIPHNFNETFNYPEYIFSYPILDTKEKTEDYKKILKNAFINSFDEKIRDSQIKFISEPDAIFSYIKSKKQDIKLNEGELFAIIDSGAGTTDFYVGTIKKNNGDIYFEYKESITLGLGGNLIDSNILNILEKNAKCILDIPKGMNFTNYWEKRPEKLLPIDKIKLSKSIKENISNKKVILRIAKEDNFNYLSVNKEKFLKEIIQPLLKKSSLEIDKKFSYGIDIEKIENIIMVGGLNISQYMRNNTILNIQNKDILTDEDRLNAISIGSIIDNDNSSKKSFATFIVKDENETIKEVIIKEGDVITQKSHYIPPLQFDEDTVILNLYAKSELWNNELKKVASARCNIHNIISKDYGDNVNFIISVSEKHCEWHIKCDISAGGYYAIGWDINI